ncbi:uncharacterized protein TNCV_3061791 [Trichonephila clavipes]|nr:uncharacterized protein TNCV_3061791 [Trichonephila clavipes]
MFKSRLFAFCSSKKYIKIGEIAYAIEIFIELARQINLKVNSDDIPELLNFHNHELTIDELIEMHKQKQDIEEERRFVEWAQNEIAVVPDFHKRILFSDEAHFWLNGYVNKQNCRIWNEANLQVYVETSLHPEKLTVWCALWAGGILLQKR